MILYNIIYAASGREAYLWNGKSLDKLKNTHNQHLYFSGRTFKHEELLEQFRKCKQAVSAAFPGDDKPDIKPVEILISK
jgi:hypothetical protein